MKINKKAYMNTFFNKCHSQEKTSAHSDYRLKFYNTFSARSNTGGCKEKVFYTFLYILRRKTWFIKNCLL